MIVIAIIGWLVMGYSLYLLLFFVYLDRRFHDSSLSELEDYFTSKRRRWILVIIAVPGAFVLDKLNKLMKRKNAKNNIERDN